MSTTFYKFLWIFLPLTVILPLFAQPIELDFRNKDTGVEDWVEFWEPVTVAAETTGALSVEEPPGQVAGNHRALVIMDVLDSSMENLNDEAGTPVYKYEFDSIAAGTLRFRAGTSGTQNQNASFILKSNGRTLMIVRLVNNKSGMLVSRSGTLEFTDSESWYNRARDFEVEWTEEGKVSFSFTRASGEAIQHEALGFLAPGSLDEIVVQVGFGRATNKGLRIESFELKSFP